MEFCFFYFLFLYKPENRNRGTSRVRAFALQRVEDFFDGVSHGDIDVSSCSRIREVNPTIVGRKPSRYQLAIGAGKHRFALRDTIHF